MTQYSRIDSNGFGGSRIRLSCFLIIAIPLAIIILTSIRVVQPAEACVVKWYGKVSDQILTPGISTVTPLSTLTCFSLRKQLLETDNSVPTAEGLSVELDVAIVFSLNEKNVRAMFLSVGKDYVNTIISPELASAIRGLTAEHDAKSLYTSARQELQDELHSILDAKLNPYGIDVYDVLLKSVQLPQLLVTAIESKAKAEQEAQQMEFVLAKERSEADRKRIEAQGIADFQNIVSHGISSQLLQWKGIEATEKFANSPNTKIVIVGNNGDSLPVILSATEDNDRISSSVTSTSSENP
uniref:Prohibitin n=1 Tax=Aureoumbra lagunensis TaxID=44058 RepID=A0A7S3JWE6_9STRA